MNAASKPWRDPTPLARPIVWLQRALVVLGLGMALFDVARLVLLAGVAEFLPVAAAPAPYDQVSTVGALVSLANGVMLLVAGVMSLVWIFRTNRNAHGWAPGMTVSPAWGVGWFFIPVAGLWKPFGGVSQTWRASVDPAGWRTHRAPVLLRWWWALFLIDNVAGQISGRLEVAAHEVGPERVAASVSLVSDLTGVALAVVFARVVTGLTALQSGRAAGLEAKAFEAAEVFGP